MSNKKFKFAGIEIDNLTREEVLNKIEKLIINNEKSYVLTPNAQHIVLLQKDEQMKRVYKNAALSVPDGFSLVFVSKIFNAQLKERITGSDLLYDILNLSNKKKYKIYLLGAKRD